MTVDEITNMLEEWFTARVGESVVNERYGESEHVDSFDVLQLVVYAETTFAVRFTAEDFTSPEFATLGGMARLIRSRIG
jgi:acyl carrier protein